jgi:5-(carboxyamino)imidazole ribonucleotide synthase
LAAHPPRPLVPGATIGIMGGGQLGRMTAMAAARLGYRCHIFTPDKDGPAQQVSAFTTVAAYDDAEALDSFSKSVDVVTFEFENVPHDSVRRLAQNVPLRPDWKCLHISQDRLREKDFLNRIGTPTAPYRAVGTAIELANAVKILGRPAVLKTTRLGYDGKGQVLISPNMNLGEAWELMGANEGVLEEFVDFRYEVSAIIARNPAGETAAFDIVENRHKDHILATTIAPARIPDDMAEKAAVMARHIAESLELVGLLAVEMFITSDGRLLINEIAPRPHNSGHWTIDACITSQFEQFVRAVCGLPLGSPRRHSDAVMTNLIGDDAADWQTILADPEANFNLYGKTKALPGRKMGHITRLYPRGSQTA